jgi:hypothetical protein
MCPELGKEVNQKICDICVTPCDEESARRVAEEIMDSYPAIGHKKVRM